MIKINTNTQIKKILGNLLLFEMLKLKLISTAHILERKKNTLLI